MDEGSDWVTRDLLSCIARSPLVTGRKEVSIKRKPDQMGIIPLPRTRGALSRTAAKSNTRVGTIQSPNIGKEVQVFEKIEGEVYPHCIRVLAMAINRGFL